MPCCYNRHKSKNKHTITKIPDKLWDTISHILPDEKPNNTIGRPVIPFRKVMDGIVYVLRTGCQWKMLPKEYGSGYQPVTDDFNSGFSLTFSKSYGLDY